MPRAAQAAVNKPWMTNTASAFLRLRLLPQRQRAPPPLSKHSRASFESIPSDGQSEFICPEKKLRAFITAKRRRREQTKPRKKHPLPTHRARGRVCGGCCSFDVFGLFRPIFHTLTSSRLIAANAN